MPYSDENATRLASLIRSWISDGRFPDSVIAAAFVLAGIALREGSRKWAVGMRQESGERTLGTCRADSASNDKSTCETYLLGDIPGLCAVLRPHPSKLLNWIGRPDRANVLEKVRLVDVFERCRLGGKQKPVVNRAILGWLRNRRPFVLTDRIPTPTELLHMQANGRRAVTIFTKEDEFKNMHESQLAYMDEFKLHARDALDFMTHDLSHMERFWGDTYFEQVGFFSAMANSLDESGRPWHFFRQHTSIEDMKILWPRLQYVFSDMNCWVTHLLSYLKAKWMLTVRSSEESTFPKGWSHFLDRIGLKDAAREAAERMCGDIKISRDEAEALRDFFKAKGRERLSRQDNNGGRERVSVSSPPSSRHDDE